MVGGSEYTDLDLQWFRGGVQVVEVVHLVTEEDIVRTYDTCVHCQVEYDFPADEVICMCDGDGGDFF